MSGKDHDLLIQRLVTAGIDIYDARLEVAAMEECAGSEEELLSFISRREKNEPAAYILGYKDFYRSRFHVTPEVLIPRSDTELLVETGLRFLDCLDMPLGDVQRIDPVKRGGTALVADLCTGTGCVGLSIFGQMREKGRDIRLYMADISDKALNCASQNVSNLVTESDKTLVSLLMDDILETDGSKYTREGKLDLIVSNPPYITDDEMKELPEDVLYEPDLALRGGEDGLLFYFRLAFISKRILKENGALAVEHGCDQGAKVREIFAKSGFNNVTTLRDYGGNERVTFGRL